MIVADLVPGAFLLPDYRGAGGWKAFLSGQVERYDAVTALVGGVKVRASHVALYLGGGQVGETTPEHGVAIDPLDFCLCGASTVAVRMPADPVGVLQTAEPILRAGGKYSFLDIAVLAKVMPLRNTIPGSPLERARLLREIEAAADVVQLWQRCFPAEVCSELAASFARPAWQIPTLRCDPVDSSVQCPLAFTCPGDVLRTPSLGPIQLLTF